MDSIKINNKLISGRNDDQELVIQNMNSNIVHAERFILTDNKLIAALDKAMKQDRLCDKILLTFRK